MNFETIMINGEEYKLYLSTQQAIQIEKKIGRSLMSVLLGLEKLDIQLNDLIIIFHGILQEYNHGLSMQKAMALYESMKENSDDYENGFYAELLMKCASVISQGLLGKSLKA